MEETEVKPPTSGRKLFYGLFIFPLIIAVFMAVLLCSVVLLTREVETPETLISDIKSSSPSQRWQKAFELANELNRDPAMFRSHAIMNEIVHILQNRGEYDPKTRSYMAMALARFENIEAQTAILKSLEAEDSSEVQLYLIWAIGQQKIIAGRQIVEGFLGDSPEDLKKMATYVLGVLGDAKSSKVLIPLLNSESQDIRWNAALSLARLKNDAGLEVIMKMLDRNTLSAYNGLTDQKIEEVMVNAIKGLALLQPKSAWPILKELSRNDQSLKVRQAALEVIDEFE